VKCFPERAVSSGAVVRPRPRFLTGHRFLPCHSAVIATRKGAEPARADTKSMLRISKAGNGFLHVHLKRRMEVPFALLSALEPTQPGARGRIRLVRLQPPVAHVLAIDDGHIDLRSIRVVDDVASRLPSFRLRILCGVQKMKLAAKLSDGNACNPRRELVFGEVAAKLDEAANIEGAASHVLRAARQTVQAISCP
jgi:hypothetical protein